MQLRYSFASTIIICLGIAQFGCSTRAEEEVSQKSNRFYFRPDSSFRPQEDFFTYVNSGWLKGQVAVTKPITSLHEVRQKDYRYIIELLERLSATNIYADGSDVKKTIDFYTMLKDSARTQRLGVQPVLQEWNAIDRLQSPIDFQQYFTRLALVGRQPIFHIVSVTRGGELRLEPSKNPWLAAEVLIRNDAASRADRQLYESTMASMLAKAGLADQPLRKFVSGVLKTEIKMASVTAKRPRYVKVAELGESFSGFNWPTYLTSLSVQADSVWVENPEALKEWGRMLADDKKEEFRLFLKWRTFQFAAMDLDSETERIVFAFLHRKDGKPYPPPAERLAMRINQVFPDVVGKFYLREHLTRARVDSLQAMMADIKLTMAAHIKERVDVPDSVKRATLAALKNIQLKVVEPTTWTDYRDFQQPDSASNSLFAWMWEASRFQRVTAGQLNSGVVHPPVQFAHLAIEGDTTIVVTPALLQEPYYYKGADSGINYGALGSWLATLVSQMANRQMGSTTDRAWVGVDDSWNVSPQGVTLAWEAWNRQRSERGQLHQPDRQMAGNFFMALASMMRTAELPRKPLPTTPTATQPVHPVNLLLRQVPTFRALYGLDSASVMTESAH